MRRLMWLGALAWIGACATTPHMTAAELASRAEANVLVAQRDLAGETIVVHGTVRGSTLVTRTKMEAHMSWVNTAEAEMVSEGHPMVVLEPGSVQCNFRPENLDDAAKLQQGQDVALKCVVNSFQTKGPKAISVLSDCRRAR